MSLVLQSLLPFPNSCQGTSPHQQGWDTKMAMLSFCGIDVSKDRLDVVVLPEGWFFSVSNDTAGGAELVARFRPVTVSAIGLEPSGGYERGIIRALLAAAVGATYQPEQASSVRPRPRRAGQERPPRCAADRRVCRNHADTSCAAGRCGRKTRRDRDHAATAV